MIIKTMAGLALLAVAGAANAVSYVAVNGAPDAGPAAGEVTFVNFDKPVADTGFTLTGGYVITSGTSNNGAAPAGDGSKYLYVSSALSPNNATLTSPFALKSIGFYWGSIDAYNSVDVLGSVNGGATQTLFTLGGSALPPSNGDRSTAQSNQRVTFTAGNGEAITGLRFASTGVAFELDDVAGKLGGGGSIGAVPEPASWALFVSGFGLIGLATRRRNRGVTTVAA